MTETKAPASDIDFGYDTPEESGCLLCGRTFQMVDLQRCDRCEVRVCDECHGYQVYCRRCMAERREADD